MRAALALAVLVALALPSLRAAPPVLDCDPACNVRVTLTTGPANEVAIAVNPNDPDNLVAVAKDYALGDLEPCDASNVWMGVYVSRDGGRGWTNALMRGHPGDDLDPPMSLFECSTDPVVGFLPSGRALIAGLGLGSPGLVRPSVSERFLSGVWAAESADGGASWQDVSVPGPQNLGGDKVWMGIDASEETGYLGWYGNGMEITRRVDGPAGPLWSLPLPIPNVNLLPPGPISPLPPGFAPAPFVDPKHDLFVGRIETPVGEQDIWVAHSPDQGLTWDRDVFVARSAGFDAPNTPYRLPNFPSFAADHDGTLLVAWQDGRSGNPDIIVARSIDGGVTWSEPTRITDDPPGPSVQFFPALAVGPDSCVHAAWYDRRDDPGNYLVGLYYSRSCDGGATWSPNLRVIDQTFDPALSYHQEGDVFLGDYIGIAVGSDGVAHPVWTDTRTGRADMFTARILP